MNKKIIFTVISIVYIIILFMGAFVFKIGGETAGMNGFDKIQHFIGFFILVILLLLTLTYYKLNNRYWASLLIALGIGIVIEAAQAFIPGRESSLLDLAADAGGIMLGLVLSWTFSKL